MHFDRHAAILRWHDAGRPEIREEDLRIDAVTLGMRAPQYIGAVHIPTGVCVTTKDGHVTREVLLAAVREVMHTLADRVTAIRKHQLN